MLREGQKHFFGVARRQASTLIFDVNQNAIGGGVSIQYNFGVRMRELEGVLEQVSYGREEQVPVGIYGKPRVDIGDSQGALLDLSLEHGGMPNFSDKVGHRKQTMLHRQSRRHPNLGEGAIDEIAQSDEAAVEDGARRALFSGTTAATNRAKS